MAQNSSMVFKQKIERQFQNIANIMLAEVDIATSSTRHGATKGRHNEQVLINFLRKFLPSRYSISQGQIVTPSGELSPQIDVIIHDETIYPVATILESGDKVIFAHSVYAVIAVKSRLFHDQTDSLLKNLQQVYLTQQKAREETPLNLIRAIEPFEYSYFGFVFINEEKEVLKKLNSNEFNANEFLNAIAILKDNTDSGSEGLYITSKYHRGDRIIRKDKLNNTLLAFYRTLFNELCKTERIEMGSLDMTKEIIKSYEPWGNWGFD